MSKGLLFNTLVRRDALISRFILISLFLFGGAVAATAAPTEFDPNGWKVFREMHIPGQVQEGIVGVALQSEILERCRPDLADVRVVSSSGTVVPILLTETPKGEETSPFPARIFRAAKRPGKFTEIWIDKGSKLLTRAIEVQTSSTDFMRKVEIRGSDNARDTYVILMDGLIADVLKPASLHSLDIEHPLNNFQYFQLRILDEDQPPLKIEGVLCCPAGSSLNLTRPQEMRVTEKRVIRSNNSTVIGMDLGEKRFPVNSVWISTPTKQFVKEVRLLARTSEGNEPWQEVYGGTFFRIRKDDAVKQRLQARFKPQSSRYLKLEISGPGPAVSVDEIKAAASVRMAVFEYRKNMAYRFYYDNPQAKPSESGQFSASMNLGQVAASSSEISFSAEQQVPELPVTRQAPHSEAAKPSMMRKIVGVTMLLVGLLILFALMLRARSLRKVGTRRNSRVFGTRL